MFYALYPIRFNDSEYPITTYSEIIIHVRILIVMPVIIVFKSIMFCVGRTTNERNMLIWTTFIVVLSVDLLVMENNKIKTLPFNVDA